MPMLPRLTILLLLFLDFAPSAHRFCLDDYSQAAKAEQKPEVVTPLTEVERSLDLRAALLQQPDFAADLSFFVNEGHGGYSGGEHFTRKGQRYREESQYWVFLGEIGKGTMRLYPSGKVYDEMVPSRVSATEGSLQYPQAFALSSTTSLKALGTVELDGHKCLKIEIVDDGWAGNDYLYAALDLKNLVIARQSLGPRASMIERLSNVSLQVPDGLLDIPADYKPIEHVRWTRVASAKVMYGVKPSKNYCVFRAPGGELFIRIGDAYDDWTYLYRPEKKTVEIAFQGLLVNRSGEYIWKTAESEAFSSTGYSRLSNAIDAHLEQIPNGIRFRSNNYDQDQAAIEITWR